MMEPSKITLLSVEVKHFHLESIWNEYEMGLE